MQHIGGGLARWSLFGTLWGSLARWILLYEAKILILCIDLIFMAVMHVGDSSARWVRCRDLPSLGGTPLVGL